MAFYDRVRFKPSGAPGTGAITVGAAETGFTTPAGAQPSAIPNATALTLLAEDGAAWEIFESVYTTAGTSCSRGTLIASSSGSRLSLSATAIISVIASARQIPDKHNGDTFVGTMRFTAAPVPNSSDGAALGSASLMWADLFLASGGVINWNNGNVTLTQASNTLTVGGATLSSLVLHVTSTLAATAYNAAGVRLDCGLGVAGAIIGNSNIYGNGWLSADTDVSSHSTTKGITWLTASPTQYGIYRTSGSWSGPDYQQLYITFLTGIIIDGGNTGGKAGVQVLGPGITVGSPTGGFKGSGTINVAGDIYKNNTAYTNPDFVFEHFYRDGKVTKFADRPGAKDYAGLMPISDLRDFTRANLRLPGISDEPLGMFDRGDVALRLIEENTLYIMQLHDRVERLERNHHARH